MTDLDRLHQHEDEMVLEYGQAIRHVVDGDDDGSIPFTYTVGQAMYGAPDWMLSGPIDPRVVARLLNYVGLTLEPKPEAGGVLDIGGKYPFRVVEVTDLEAAELYGCFKYGDNVRANQLVWPDRNGRYPGDDGYDQEAYPQEVHGEWKP